MARKVKASTTKTLKNLVVRAEKGDAEAMGKFLAMEKGAGDGSFTPVLKKWGDLAALTENALIGAAVGDTNLMVREGLKRTIADMKADLCGPKPSPLERLLVDRIVLAWVQLQHVTAKFAEHMADGSAQWEELHQARQDRASDRFLKAVKALATIRKLAVNVQVNFADKIEQQVNFPAGPQK